MVPPELYMVHFNHFLIINIRRDHQKINPIQAYWTYNHGLKTPLEGHSVAVILNFEKIHALGGGINMPERPLPSSHYCPLLEEQMPPIPRLPNSRHFDSVHRRERWLHCFSLQVTALHWHNIKKQNLTETWL